MCGVTGYLDLQNKRTADPTIVARMTEAIRHRGPDSDGFFIEGSTALGFRRLSIIDLATGDQPIFNEDGSLVLLCNGEIYNYPALRTRLQQKGHVFQTHSDVEVILHLYEEMGPACLHELNGQFAIILYDRHAHRLFVARDQLGVAPLYYTIADGYFVFGSEIKAILQHPAVRRAVDLAGLDQIFTFPGLAGRQTMFQGIHSLANGRYLFIADGQVQEQEYWDLEYPVEGELAYDKPESEYVERLQELFAQSVRYRLQADVPVGFYLSGGLDSSLIAAMIQAVSPQIKRHSFSIHFADRERDESKYQKMVSSRVNTQTHDVFFDWANVADHLHKMVYHAECPVKETYNTCFLRLSQAVHEHGYKVILTGEGADELFAGYVGYRFDQVNMRQGMDDPLTAVYEEELRQAMWGDKDIFYERHLYPFREIKQALYATAVNQQYPHFEAQSFGLINPQRLQNRHPIHRRSYLDFKLRMTDHLLMDHGDRMAFANSVEARYPFLDIELVEFAKTIPPHLKLHGLTEKYIVRKVAENILPPEIAWREKFGWHAASSPELLQQNIPWVQDLLSYDRLKRQGYFNPDTIEHLKTRYAQPGFRLHLPFENDLLITVLTFNLFLEIFQMPDFS